VKRRTINQAITEALKREGKPLRVPEIYSRIIEDDLYRFKAIHPENIVRVQLRRHCENLDFPTAHKSKHFVLLKDGRYWMKDAPYDNMPQVEGKSAAKKSMRYEEIRELHKKYLNEFKSSALKQLQELDPFEFESFCKELLLKYGFRNVKVTQKSKDGGIDGFGVLKIGLATMQVAFECKRWTGAIGRPKISQFRGDIQGKFQQGVFFATSHFSKDALNASFQSGAVPIVLIDGKGIIDLMVEKEFGIETENLPIYTLDIDLALQGKH